MLQPLMTYINEKISSAPTFSNVLARSMTWLTIVTSLGGVEDTNIFFDDGDQLQLQ